MANHNHYIYYYSMARNSDYSYFSKCYFRLFQRKMRKKKILEIKPNKNKNKKNCRLPLLYIVYVGICSCSKYINRVSRNSNHSLHFNHIGHSNSHFLNEHFTIVDYFSISFIQVILVKHKHPSGHTYNFLFKSR